VPQKKWWTVERVKKKEKSERYDAIVLAGDRKASRKVKGRNKALLQLEGRTILGYVLDGLLDAKYVKDIYIVGPKKKIEKAIAPVRSAHPGRKLIVLEQWDNLIENAWNGFLHTIPGYKDGMDPSLFRGTPHFDKAVIGLSGDIPLLTGYEVDEFIENTNLKKYDYQPGITEDVSLKYYYPDGEKNKKGIKHAYFHFREGRFRQNNLHFGRLFRVANKIYIEKMYEFRHQREWRDIVELAIEILRTEKGSYKSFYYYLVLQLCMTLTNSGFGSLADVLRKRAPLVRVEGVIGNILGTRVRSVVTTYGGAALDIDSDEEFLAIRENYHEWMAYQEDLHAKREKRRQRTKK
jgi:CTP:molybdopterin cytidylyltransferase MocA